MLSRRARSWGIGFCVLIAGLATAAISGDEKVPATVFYSKRDPNWTKCEAVIEEVLKKHSYIGLKKVCIDEKSGYKKLAEEEKALKINPTGDITFVFGPLYLTSKGQRRDIENYLGPMLARMDETSQAYGEKRKPKHQGRLETDVKKYAAEIFGAGTTLETRSEPQENYHIYAVVKEGKAAGWVVDAYQPIGCPVCNDSQFTMAIGTDLKILDLRPVRELERWGGTLPAHERDAFLAQFKGKKGTELPAKVDGISAGTKTSLQYRGMIGEILEKIAELKVKG